MNIDYVDLLKYFKSNNHEKTKFINLMLLTVSFTAAAKRENKFMNTTLSSSLQEHVAGKVNDEHFTGVFVKPYTFENYLQTLAPPVKRGGFGDKARSGAEQHHNEKK